MNTEQLKEFFIGPSGLYEGGQDAGLGFTVLEQITLEHLEKPCIERVCVIPTDDPDMANCWDGEEDRVSLPTPEEIDDTLGDADGILLHTHPISVTWKKVTCPSVNDMASIAVLMDSSPKVKASCLLANYFVGDTIKAKLKCWSHDTVTRGLADIAMQTIIDKPYSVSTRGSSTIK